MALQEGKLKYHIQTFGCQMNYSDTERIASILSKSGYELASTLEDVDLYIFNTCSIKQKGEDRVFGIIENISSYKKANPRLLIGITGCMVRKTSSRNSPKDQKDQLLKTLEPLDFVFKITETHKLPEVLAEAEPLLELPEIGESSLNDYLKITPKYTNTFQATVPIQIGCDKYCTYCIVPYSRGREQSRPQQDILEECRKLVENGCKEITLVGQTVNSYGLSSLDRQKENFQDYYQALSAYQESVKLGEAIAKPVPPFVVLLREIDKLAAQGLSRLRFTSPHPRDFSDELIEAYSQLKTLCPYLHLPIQSGDDQILSKMNRKYTVDQYRQIIQKLRKQVPNMVITTDIIVGFCDESDQQFANTARLFEEIRWDQAYISRYSERVGTLANKHFPDNISAEQKSKRWHHLNNLLKVMSKEKNLVYEGHTLEVLVEKFNSLTGECEGRSRDMKVVQFPGEQQLVGQLVQIKIIRGLDWLLKGELV